MIQANTLKKQAVSSAVYLVVKRVLVQIIFTFSNIALARLLLPEDFGTMAIILSLGTVFMVFADLGLAPSLVQKKNRLNYGEIKTAFWYQIIVAFALILVIFIFSNSIISFYKLSESSVWQLRLYSLVFLISPFRQIPSALLERELNFKRIVVVDLFSIFCSSLVSVVLALFGFGVFSLILGTIVGHLLSAILLTFKHKEILSFAFNKKTFSKLISFGLPYQLNVFLGLFYGPLALLYLGNRVGSVNLGYFQFASSISVLPMAISEIMGRIIFPLGSRFQNDNEKFRNICEKAITLVSLTTFPIVFLMMVLARNVVSLIYTEKWIPALPAIYLGLAQMTIISFTSVFSQLLLSRGFSKTIRNMGLVFAILTWAFAPFLIIKYGFYGMSITNLIVSIFGLWFYVKLKREVNFKFVKSVMFYFLASFLMAIFIFCLNKIFPLSIISLIILTILGVFLYFIFIFLFQWRDIKFSAIYFYRLFFNKEK